MQQQLNEMKQAKMKSDAEHRAFVQMAQQQMTTMFETVSKHQIQNEQLINKNASSIPTPMLPTSTPVESHPPSTASDVNATLVDLLQYQKESREDKESSNMKFPKFYGKSKQEFEVWHDQSLSILASPGWNKVFQDLKTKKLKTDNDISESLPSRLYAALRVAMGGNAEKLMMTKPETWGKGLLFFHILKKSYKGELHRADLLKKEKEYSLLFQTSSVLEIENNSRVLIILTRCALLDVKI